MKIWEVIARYSNQDDLDTQLDAAKELDRRFISGELDTLLSSPDVSVHQQMENNSLDIYAVVFSLYEDTTYSADSDIYKELSDFLDNTPDIGILVYVDSNILQYYVIDSIEKRRMSKERVLSLIELYLEEEFVHMPSIVLIMTYVTGMLTYEEITALLDNEECDFVEEIVPKVLDGREMEGVSPNVSGHHLHTLFNCVAIMSTERLVDLAKAYHEVMSCEDLLMTTMNNNDFFLTEYNVLVESIIIRTSNKPLMEYKHNNTNIQFSRRLTQLLATLDQV